MAITTDKTSSLLWLDEDTEVVDDEEHAEVTIDSRTGDTKATLIPDDPIPATSDSDG